MTRFAFVYTLLVAVPVCLLPAAPAHAQVNRTFVSAAGSDSNNCANVTSPCRHFAAAYAVTAPSGEIFVLDPANYGSLTITHAVSIEGHGWASIAPPNNGNAITINAGPSDSISIHGVAINGTGATGGTNGIVFNSGGSLTVDDCIVQNFIDAGNSTTGNGILLQPTSSQLDWSITNTIVANNTNYGISYSPPNGSPTTTHGVIDHVAAKGNFDGIAIQMSAGAAGTVSVSNSIASNNSNIGIYGATNGGFTLSIDNVSVTSNWFGIYGVSLVKVTLGRSVVTGNKIGIHNGIGCGSSVCGAFYTYQDNRIDLNDTDIDTAGTLVPKAWH
jgi:hypothetical protein